MRHVITHEAMVSDGLLLVRQHAGVALVILVGKSMREGVIDDLEARLHAVADAAQGRVALSLAGVADMSSAGINALLRLHARCRQLGGALACFAPEPDVAHVLEVTRLSRRLPILPSLDDAAGAIIAATRRSRSSWLARVLRSRAA